MKGVGISRVEVYERVVKSVIRYLKGPFIKIFRTHIPSECAVLILNENDKKEGIRKGFHL